MAFLKKIVKAVAPNNAAPSTKSTGMGGAISKLLQKPGVKEAMASGPAAKAAAAPMTARTAKRPIRALADVAGRTYKTGGAVDKAGRALGKKTADAKGRAMAKTPMKKNMGGMAKKSSKKC
jgi:hypothetical protein